MTSMSKLFSDSGKKKLPVCHTQFKWLTLNQVQAVQKCQRKKALVIDVAVRELQLRSLSRRN